MTILHIDASARRQHSASGGTPMASDMDFATGYIARALGFVGIADVTFIAADALASKPRAMLRAACAAIDTLAA